MRGRLWSSERERALRLMMAPAIGRFVDTPHARLHLIEAGDPADPALVLLHGASGNLRDFTTSVFDRLAARWRVIAVDRPGFGLSVPNTPQDARRPWWRLDEQIAAIEAALDALGVERFALLAHSYAVGLGLDWALRRPERVSGLLALSGAMLDWRGATAWRYRWGRRGWAGAAMGRMAPLVANDLFLISELAEVFHPQQPPPRYLESGGIRLATRPYTFSLNVKAVAELYDELRESVARIGEIRQPIEALHGDADAIIPLKRDPGPAAAAAPNAHFEVLEGVGHMPHHAAPEAVLAAAERLRRRL